MKFERLRLAGFKSFCDQQEFKIEPGLTGIVGPNGCGKSNLVEAMRWVMGESSYKNMRASGMDDVIFSGSGRRPSRNIAEVGLVLDNSDRRAPAAFNDHDTIEVTRKIEREFGLDLPRQRPRSARARRAAAVRRRLHRRALALDGPAGADRRDHLGQAAGAAPDPRRSRRRLRPAFAPPRGRAAPQGGGGKSASARRRAEADRGAAREPRQAGQAGLALPRARRRDPPPRRALKADRLARDRKGLCRGRTPARGRRARRRRADARPGRDRAPRRRSPPPRCRTCATRKRAPAPPCIA